MDEQPVTAYQAKERLEERRDFARVAFGEECQRIDAKAEAAASKLRQRKKDLDKQQETFRFQMMVSRHYAALYNRVMAQIQDTQAKICAAIIEVQGQLQDAELHLGSVLEKANKLNGETPVFRYEDGTVRTNMGRILNEQERASLVWQDDMPKGEAFDRARQSLDGLNNGLLLLQGYDADMQGYAAQAEALENTDTPESRLLLQDFAKKVGAINKNVEMVLNDQTKPATPKSTIEIPLNIPDYSQ